MSDTPLTAPPPVSELVRLPPRPIAGATLHRIYQRHRHSPWWFASLLPDADFTARSHAGRFDLPHPEGASYWSTSPIAATLEAFQGFGRGLFPESELRRRRRAEVIVPQGSRPAAWLSSGKSRRFGITQGLWAGQDRPLTQMWAALIRRAGWSSMFHGVQHDPTGRLRGVTFFDLAGSHPPLDDEDGWRHTDHDLHDDHALIAALGRYGISVTRSDPSLPMVGLDDSGLL